MSQQNREYFAERVVAELEMSRTASDPRAASAHAELAEMYKELAAKFEDHNLS